MTVDDDVASVLAHIGLTPADLSDDLLSVVRDHLEQQSPDPRALAAQVGRGGGGRGYAQQRQAGRRVDVSDAELDQMTARQLAELVSPKELF